MMLPISFCEISFDLIDDGFDVCEKVLLARAVA